MKRFWRWLFEVREGDRSTLEIIGWWEIRRIPYNLLILPIGLVSLIVFFVAILSTGHLKPGEDAVEPLAVLAAPFAMNFFYTAGWLAEVSLKLLWRMTSPAIAPALLKLGLMGSFVVVLLPSVYWVTYLIALKLGLPVEQLP
jgi:hypothetical protein